MNIRAFLIAAGVALVSASPAGAQANCSEFELSTKDLYKGYQLAAARELQKFREKNKNPKLTELWEDMINRYIAGQASISPMIGVLIVGMKDKLHDPPVERAICSLGPKIESTTPTFVCATLIAHDPARTRAQKIIEIDKMVSEAAWSLKKRQALAKNKAAAAANDPFIKRMKLHLSALDKCYGTKLAAKLPQAAATPVATAAAKK